MQNLIINNKKTVKGCMSITKRKEAISKTQDKVFIGGLLKIHNAIEEITSIESFRYRVTGIDVVEEAYGSDDFFILYKFTARDLEVKGGETLLTEDEINKEILKIEGDEK